MKHLLLISFLWVYALGVAQTCDTAKITYYSNASEDLLNKDQSKSYLYAKNAFELSKNCSNEIYYFKGLRIYCNLLLYKSENDSIISLLIPILESKKISDQNCIGILNNNLSSAYGNLLNSNKSIEYALKAAEAFRKAKNKINEANAIINVGNAYRQLHDKKNSIRYLYEALDISRKNNFPEIDGNVYNTLGITYAENNELDSAEKYFLKSTEIREKLNEANNLAWNYNNLGGLYVLMDKIKPAIFYLEKAFIAFENIGNYDGQSGVCNNLGELYSRQGNFDKALKYFNFSRYLFIKTNNPDNLESLYTNLYNLYKEKGDKEISLKYSDSLLAFKDSIYGVRMENSIAEMQAKFDLSKKDELLKEHQLLLQYKEKELYLKNWILYSSIALSLLVILTIWIVFNRKKLKEKLKLDNEMALEKQKLSNMIFLSEQRERMRIARDLHDSLGQKLAALKMQFNNSNQPNNEVLTQLNSTITEVRNISHNLIPEELNFGLFSALESLTENAFKNKKSNLVIDENCRNILIHQIQALNIYRVIQELIANNLKHSESDNINISISSEQNNLIIIFQDNGQKINLQQIKTSKGIGWKNIFARLNLLLAKIEFDYKGGNIIKITIPIQNELNGES